MNSTDFNEVNLKKIAKSIVEHGPGTIIVGPLKIEWFQNNNLRIVPYFIATSKGFEYPNGIIGYEDIRVIEPMIHKYIMEMKGEISS